jgi:alkylation response protein AidB-like acyl-CoA dehydrogenase
MAVSHLSDDEQTLIEAIREIAQERVAPRAAEIDHTSQFPWDMKELLSQQDILAMPFPSEYGGIEASELAVVMAIEELARYCATTSLILAVQQLGSLPIMLADMATKVEAARLLVYNSAEMIDRGGQNFSKYSSMAKMYASDIAMEVTGDAVQILGGYGYMKEYPAERMMRDAKITQIYEGTNQIQRLVIARELLGEQ